MRFTILLLISCGLVMLVKGSNIPPQGYGDFGNFGKDDGGYKGGDNNYCYIHCSDDKGGKDDGGYGGYRNGDYVICNPPPPTYSDVPEPMTGGLIGLGLVTLGILRRKYGTSTSTSKTSS